MAEGGTLPDRRARMERAREASARTWMRHLARGFEDVWDGAERRGAELAAHCRLFAEALATEAEPLAGEPPPVFSRRVASWVRAQERRRREVEEQARAAWRAGPAPASSPRATAAPSPEPDELRVSEAAAVWAHVRLLAEALEHALGARPEAPG